MQYDRVPGCEDPLFDAWNITPISSDDMTEMVEHCIVQGSPKIAIPDIILPRKLRQVLSIALGMNMLIIAHMQDEYAYRTKHAIN